MPGSIGSVAFRMEARAGAVAHKLRILRGELAFRLVGSVASLLREEDGVLLWPPHDLPADGPQLERVRERLRHYLRGLEVPVRYFAREGGRLWSHEERPDGRQKTPAAAREQGPSAAFRRARRVLLWRSTGRPRALSLRPHLYAVADLRDYGDSHEWLRLLAELHRATSGSAAPASAPFPERTFGRVAVLGSGPSIGRFAADQERYDGCIVMNAAVCDGAVRASRKIVAVCALDPDVFGPEVAMRPFWEATCSVLRDTSALFVTARKFASFMELNFPAEIRRRCHYASGLAMGTLHWRPRYERSRLCATGYGNVLTDLALPLATTLSRDITLYGCDGRGPGVTGNFDKAQPLQAFDLAHEQERPGKYGPGFMDRGVARFYAMTRVVVDGCLAEGAHIQLRAPSHNLGLQHLPCLGSPSGD